MNVKRPFSVSDWLATPKPVRDYIEHLEQRIAELTEDIARLEALQKQMEKRIDEFESRLNRNSHNSNKPPSTDSPFSKPTKKGGQKGHQGHKQELLEASRVVDLKPEACPCGNPHFQGHRMEPYYTHQVIEFSKIVMDITHFVISSTPMTHCPICPVSAMAPG